MFFNSEGNEKDRCSAGSDQVCWFGGAAGGGAVCAETARAKITSDPASAAFGSNCIRASVPPGGFDRAPVWIADAERIRGTAFVRESIGTRGERAIDSLGAYGTTVLGLLQKTSSPGIWEAMPRQNR